MRDFRSIAMPGPTVLIAVIPSAPALTQAAPGAPEGYVPAAEREAAKPVAQPDKAADAQPKAGPYDSSGLTGPAPKPGQYDPSGLTGPPPKPGQYGIPGETK